MVDQHSVYRSLNKSGEDNFYSTSTLQYFTSSLDGELVSTTTVSSTGSRYIARTENGTFNKYTYSSSTNQWTMTDKNGTQYAFGSASDSQQIDPNNASDCVAARIRDLFQHPSVRIPSTASLSEIKSIPKDERLSNPS
jgi:hypothetical protein